MGRWGRLGWNLDDEVGLDNMVEIKIVSSGFR